MARYCPDCGAVYDDDANFCAECSVRLVDKAPETTELYGEEVYGEGIPEPEEGEVDMPAPADLPAGINFFNDQYFWDGECGAMEYRAIFKKPRLILGLIGGLIALIIALVGSALGCIVTIGITVGLYILLALFMLLQRGGRFNAHFGIEADHISISEETQPPKNIFLLIIYMILSVILFILQLAWILIGQGIFADLTSGNFAYHKKLPYKKLGGVSVSPDKRFIYVTKSSATYKLVAAPETSDYLAAKIEEKISAAHM